MPIELKKSPYLWAYAIVVVLVIGGLTFSGKVTNAQAVILLGAAIGSPGLFGTKKPDPAVVDPRKAPTTPPKPLTDEDDTQS